MDEDTSPDDYRDCGRHWDDWPGLVTEFITAIGGMMAIAISTGYGAIKLGDFAVCHPWGDGGDLATFGMAICFAAMVLSLMSIFALGHSLWHEYILRADKDRFLSPGDPHA